MSVPFDPEQVNEALLTIQDLFERSQIPFLALKETGKQIRDTQHGISSELHLRGIDLGVRSKDIYASNCFSTLKSLLKTAHIELEETEGFMRCNVNGVPVFIKIITRNYRFFQNPDKAFYRVTEFNLPNPFQDYWYSRGLIR